MGTPLMKEQWKCTTNATGVLSVIMTGTLKTLTSYVDSLATLQLPMPGSLLTLIKDQDRIYWAMLSVMEMSPISISVIIVGGLITTVIIMGTSEWPVIIQSLHPVSLFDGFYVTNPSIPTLAFSFMLTIFWLAFKNSKS